MTDLNEIDEKLAVAMATVSSELQADIIIYSGKIDNFGAKDIVQITNNSTNTNNILFILCTCGGNPHAAFKIAKRLREKYKKFSLYVYSVCKSAGTLIAVGCDEIIMSDYAEFGPLDIQLREKDEILSFNSTLNIKESLRSLKDETISLFNDTCMNLVEAGLSTKTAAELAIKLGIGFITPIVSQIDPLRIGEAQRAIKIASTYGGRLIAHRGNLQSNAALLYLINGYPDHSFVIDYEESIALFRNIRKHTNNERELGILLEDNIDFVNAHNTQPFIKKFNFKQENEHASHIKHPLTSLNRLTNDERAREVGEETAKVD